MTLALEFSRLWNQAFLRNPLWAWAGLVLVLLTAFTLGRIVSFGLERQAGRLQARPALKALGVLLGSASRPAQLMILAAGLYIAQAFLVLDVREVDGKVEILSSGPIRAFWNQVARAISVAAVAWLIYRLMDIVEHFMRGWTGQTRTVLDDMLVPLLRKTLRVFILILAGLFIAQNVFEMQIGPLIAGLGIGGLAFALAAQDSLANVFGSVVIFGDKPFAMGDRIQLKGYDGTVEEVGFRSTRIRTLAGDQVIIPNRVVAGEPIENISRRPTIRRVLDVTIAYNTPPAKVQRGVEIIRQMLDARRQHFPADPGRVYFNELNTDSLNLNVIYWFSPPDWWKYMEFTHDFNMELLSRFNEEGIEFAFPTRTLYLRPEGEFSVRPGGEKGPRVGT